MNASFAPGTVTGVDPALSTAALAGVKSAGERYETCTPVVGAPASHKQPLSDVGVALVMGVPNAVPISSDVGASHPRAWNVAVTLPEADELDPLALEPEATEPWPDAVLADVLEVVDPPLLHAVRSTTIPTIPPNATPAALARTP